MGEKLRAHLFASHTPVEDAARIAGSAGVGQLLLHHLLPVDDPRFTAKDWHDRAATVWDGRVTMGTDGMEVLL
jgi:ribonuclease BN (tRNA processing enzyme)